jgi:uncharacterized protein YacL
MLRVTKHLNYNAKKALVKGIIIGSLTIVIYLLVVIITTPSLPPISASNAAFKINSIIIFGLAVGVGAQVFIASYSKSLGCRIDKKKKEDKKGIFRNVSSGSSTAISSFFSFFSLVPLGCCGSWLVILSLLPSIFGSTLSVILINYSKILSYIGLVIVLGFAALSALKLRRELEEMRMRRRRRSKNLNISKSQLLKEKNTSYYNNNEDNI